MDANVSPNIVLDENAAFGKPAYAVIREFLYMVDANMMTALGRPVFSTRRCIVAHKSDCPMCVAAGEDHIIFLSAHDNYWCKWVYQFAHEYCHHLINGSLSGGWSSLLWLEETICELSSLYNLHRMVSCCDRISRTSYSLSVQQYLNDLLTENNNVYNLCVDGGWYQDYKELLSSEPYKRDLYNAIAVLMYPLFVENPSLWKLILNIGDIRSWGSLEELFEHLQTNADTSYLDSLKRLQKMFS